MAGLSYIGRTHHLVRDMHLRNARLIIRPRVWLQILAVSVSSTQPVHAQTLSQQEAAAFDRGDRESREILSVITCARQVALARIEGAFGPIASLGHTHQCLRIDNRWVGVFADIDSSFINARNVVAIDLRTRARFTDALDTAALLGIERAELTAQSRGAEAYRLARRSYAPIAIRFDRDTIEVWLLPASLIMGEQRTLGGERGYEFTPDGKQILREFDSFNESRPIVVPDSGQVRIVSSQSSIPTMSEFILANALHDTGRAVAIVTRKNISTLVRSAGADIWIHVAKKD
jgi:hypothetical protein